MRPTVYVETTVPSYLTARPSQNLVRAAHQKITKEWWVRRDRFELFTSRLVIEECSAGDEVAAAERIAALGGITLLEQPDVAGDLADALMLRVPLPIKATSDALHIAIATVNETKYLLTWNCRHIANVVLRPRIEAVCRTMGYEPPLICTPEELSLGDE